MDFSIAYNREAFIAFLRDKFLPEDFMVETKPVMLTTQTKYTQSVTKLGVCNSLDLVVYEVRHSSSHDARVGLSREAFRLLADEYQDKALVVFVPEDSNANYRLSFIEITLGIDDRGKLTHAFSNPRRSSYRLGEGIATYTPNKYLNEKGRVVNEDDLRSRFSVEVLTKEFYSELSDWYAWAIKIIRFPNDLTTTADDQKYNHEGAIRLITRLIFVWFLKQRGLIPWQFFDEDFIRENLLENFNPNSKVDLFYKSIDSKYYKAILQNLFFAMLNCPITLEGSRELTERRFKDGRNGYDDNKRMRYRFLFKDPELFLRLANETVPFLNGGLFDCLDDKQHDIYYDGFSERKASMEQLCVPDYLFFGEEVGKNIDLSEFYGDKNKKKVSARGIIDILKRYNFTVEENMPFDKDVSLDPELLGKVFENLLAAYNPETQSTARKQTGSFYTPREIVQYMVDESLVAHLKRTVGEGLESEYRKLLSYADDEINLSDEQRKQIMQSLYRCKILDPACGSGAFPVGILQQMVHILTQIDPDNSRWKDMLMEQAISDTSEAYRTASPEERAEMVADIERSFDENVNRPDYARKLYLIENCIFGVDILAIAIQISKLRFFISLVVDQKINNDPADNFGIRPLPNLEAKFVAANTLIGLKRVEADLFDSEEVKRKEAQMKIAKHRIFSARTSRTKQKYRNQVTSLRQEIADLLLANDMVGNEQAQQLAQWDMFDQNASSPFFDPEWMFGVKDGFDIVIANPPYVDAKKLKNQSDILKTYDIYCGSADLFTYFCEFGIKNLKDNGILTFITTNKWIRSSYGKNLRAYILKNSLQELIDFGRNRFFNATVDTNILIVAKDKENKIPQLYYVNEKLSDFNFQDIHKQYKVEGVKLNSGAWMLSHDVYDKLKSKIELAGVPLRNFNINIYRGVLTGCNNAFHISESVKDEIISNDANVKDVVVPLVRGCDTRKYALQFSNIWLINTHNGIKKQNIQPIDINTYPSIRHWLEPFYIELRKRTDKGITPYNLRNCAYLLEFKREKIIWQAVSKRIAFSYDEQGKYYGDVSTFFMTGENLKFILAILNSKLFEYAILNIYLEGDTFKSKNAIIQNFPIPRCSDSKQQEIIKIVSCILALKQTDINADTHKEEREIDRLVYKLYGLTYDEVKTVDPTTEMTEEEYNKE